MKLYTRKKYRPEYVNQEMNYCLTHGLVTLPSERLCMAGRDDGDPCLIYAVFNDINPDTRRHTKIPIHGLAYCTTHDTPTILDYCWRSIRNDRFSENAVECDVAVLYRDNTTYTQEVSGMSARI